MNKEDIDFYANTKICKFSAKGKRYRITEDWETESGRKLKLDYSLYRCEPEYRHEAKCQSRRKQHSPFFYNRKRCINNKKEDVFEFMCS